MDDNKVIDLFFNRSEDAIAELSKKYGKLCFRISLGILNNAQDAEECVNETYQEAWKTIPPKKPDSLMAYVCRLTRNISIERCRYNRAKKRDSRYDVCLDEVENYLFDSGELDDGLSDEAIASVIDGYISSLGKTDRIILVRRYWQLDSYENIAKITGLRKDAVYMRMSRIKSGLKKTLIEKGVLK